MNQPSIPVLALTGLGVLISVLGLFAAGNMVIVAIGLGAIFGAGIIGAVERMVDRRRDIPASDRQEKKL